MDMLNSKEVVAINLKPEVKQELEAQLAPQLVEEQNQAMTVEQEVDNPMVKTWMKAKAGFVKEDMAVK